MTLALWLCLAFLVVTTLGSILYAVVHGLRTFRALRAMSGPMDEAVAHIEAGTAAAEAKVAGFEGGNARLTAAVEHLQRSLAELKVLQAAADEAAAPYRRVIRSARRL